MCIVFFNRFPCEAGRAKSLFLFESLLAFSYTGDQTIINGPLMSFAGDISGRIGRSAIFRFERFMDLCAFAHSILRLLIKRPPEGRALVRFVIVDQIYFTAVEALWVVIPIALLLGTMLIIQFAEISSQYNLGSIIVMIIVRELGPIITALIVTLRSATAVTIETGYMSVLHEIDSIEMAGIDPLYVIALPRLLGITIAVLCLFIIFDLVALLGGYALAWSLTGLPLENFMAQIAKALTIPDILQGIVKGVLFGVVITVISLHRGFSTRVQITQLPISTSKAAIECLFYCLIVSMLVSVAFY